MMYRGHVKNGMVVLNDAVTLPEGIPVQVHCLVREAEQPVLDDRGEIRHEGGITPEPGFYVLGIRFQRSKGSNLIDGVGRDAEALSNHLAERFRDKAA